MIEKYLALDANNELNLIPPVSADVSRNINCHKFALFVAGVISRDDMVSDARAQKAAGEDFTFGKKAAALSIKEFKAIPDIETLLEFARESCREDKPYIGQIRDVETGEMAHSFVVEKDSEGSFRCFDKAGFKTSFGQYGIEDLFQYENYRNQEWRFIPLEARVGTV